MAARAPTTISFLLILFSHYCVANSKLATTSDQADAYILSSGPVSGNSALKQTHFRFYWHDIFSGPNPTAIQVAQAPETMNSSTLFGGVFIIDDPLTTGPDVKSKLVGRAQGFYASADLEQLGLLVAMNFALTDGKYNGSTIAIVGHNQVLSTVREMPIVGGSGLFRFASGYVEARTNSFEKTGDTTVEYNVFVNHY